MLKVLFENRRDKRIFELELLIDWIQLIIQFLIELKLELKLLRRAS